MNRSRYTAGRGEGRDLWRVVERNRIECDVIELTDDGCYRGCLVLHTNEECADVGKHLFKLITGRCSAGDAVQMPACFIQRNGVGGPARRYRFGGELIDEQKSVRRIAKDDVRLRVVRAVDIHLHIEGQCLVVGEAEVALEFGRGREVDIIIECS